ncbi:CCA tRNA nucleotidyltransferase [Novosphingobium flavum]|uniref:CCA tRNA nucleotidyltransferase n=1 Tax=Novosphingobium flavum TaxID=1778672 RepID=A0A7X1FQF2_9SPHN|nr:CCA tRNA nucleotidyltransferase [Novosphingobium flavum]MBC2665018.1 CCA tRNA nucleotidyltransferase [Novosphingobium flavum]
MTEAIFPPLLPPADWTAREDLVALMAALGGENARYVGGAVRDTLLGIPVKDVDVATVLRPEQVIERLAAAGLRTVPTGIEHGTVTAILPYGPVEITTLRHDVSTDGRRATVAFAEDWREDAARRDFTINALYAQPGTGAISDYFGGLDDLAARRVRFIGDARQRIREDHLRILRYFRFQARFGSQPADPEAEESCSELAATLKGLSRERIGMEMINLLGLADPAPTVARMAELGVLAVVLPEADPAALARLVTTEQAQGIEPDAVRRLAALLPADPALAEQVASRFRLSGAQKKRLAVAAARDGAAGDARPLAYRLGREGALDRLLIEGADIAPLRDWDLPVLPLKGGDIVARGIGAGPEVARVLRAVETRWIAEGFPDAERVQALLGEVLSGQAG